MIDIFNNGFGFTILSRIENILSMFPNQTQRVMFKLRAKHRMNNSQTILKLLGIVITSTMVKLTFNVSPNMITQIRNLISLHVGTILIKNNLCDIVVL